MTKLPQVKPHQFIRALKRLGFYEFHQKGSHLTLKHPDGRRTTISIHPQPIRKGTLHGILKDIKITPEELKKLL